MQIRIDALERSITGTIVRFTRNVNFETRTMETEVDVENKDLSIDPGMYANTTPGACTRAENVHDYSEWRRWCSRAIRTRYMRSTRTIASTFANVEVGLQGTRLAEIKSGSSGRRYESSPAARRNTPKAKR